MLQMYMMDKLGKCEDYLHLVEFAYNNGYQTLLKMTRLEALYGRNCSVPVRWDKLVDRMRVGPKMLHEMEKNVANIE